MRTLASDRHGHCFAGVGRHRRETHERGTVVQLHYMTTRSGAGVRDLDADTLRLAYRRAQLKRGVPQPEPERIGRSNTVVVEFALTPQPGVANLPGLPVDDR